MKSLVGDRPSWHVTLSRHVILQCTSYACVIISQMFLIYFISYGCNGGALVFIGGAEASASPSFALPMFITIKKRIILHLFLGVPAATVGGTGTPVATPLIKIILMLDLFQLLMLTDGLECCGLL